MRRLRACLAALLVAASCWLCTPAALAQSGGTESAPGENTESPAVAQHAIAFLSTALVLVILCAPSRKK